MRIENKKQMSCLSEMGVFGGTTKTIIGCHNIIHKIQPGLWMPRYLGAGGTDYPGYGSRMTYQNLIAVTRMWVSSYNANPSLVTAGQVIQDENLTIQGECMRTHEGLHVMYSTLKCPMREALRNERISVSGLSAKCLLETYMDHQSFDVLSNLLDEYDGAVVEFSCLTSIIPRVNRNTVFWEVRHY